jgi:digeranylgeranylglycerophospholipid reductase
LISSDHVLDVVIIGCGPAGSSAARVLSEKGHETFVIESRKEVGTPIQCGEAISSNTLKLSGLSHNGPWVNDHFSGYRIVSPSGGSLFSKTEGVNIKRDLFDRELADQAVEKGAKLNLGDPARKAYKKNGTWIVKTLKNEFRSKELVVACGSHPGRVLENTKNEGLRTMKAIGARLDKRDERDEIMFHVKGSLEGGYGWYFPRGDHVNIGVVGYKDIKMEFQWLIRSLNIDKDMIRDHRGGIIPVSGMLEPITDDGAFMIGDSSGASNPVSKGGIVGAIVTGKGCGSAISERTSGDDKAIGNWIRSMERHPALNRVNLDRAALLSSLDDEVLDALTSIADGRDIWSIRKTDVIRDIWKRPYVLKALRGALKLSRGGKEWANWAF